jgi:hypothetical protein
MTSPAYDRSTQDVGNMISLDHLNLTIPDQQMATLFYIVGLGLTRDPYLTVGLENMWVNLGRQQFHLPTSGKAQNVRGHIGLVVPSLEQLQQRLERIAPRLKGTAFSYSAQNGTVEVTCPWGNVFRCTDEADSFGGTRVGMPYIRFNVPQGTATGIAHFYETVIGTNSRVEDVDGATAAVVSAGRGQSLVFREDASDTRPYDGHHIAVYLADFSGPHRRLGERGLVTEESNEHQYRFKDIIDLESGRVLYELEHEVRSFHHPMFQRPLVNRNASVESRNYSRGADGLVVG